MRCNLRKSAPAVAALAVLLAGCGGSGKRATVEDAQPSAPAASAMPVDDGTGTPAADASATVSAEAAATGPASAPPLTGAMPVACSASIGPTKAARLVKQCIAVSPATHPPCNAANSCAMIEGEIARSCALLGTDAAGEAACKPDPGSGAAAVAAVRRYYDAIANSDFGTAYGTWGDDGHNSGKSFDAFRAGFTHTVAVRVDTGRPGVVEGAAGSLYVEVPVTVDAELDNGRHQHFTGAYTLRQSSGAGGPSQGWRIYSAKLKGG